MEAGRWRLNDQLGSLSRQSKPIDKGRQVDVEFPLTEFQNLQCKINEPQAGVYIIALLGYYKKRE